MTPEDGSSSGTPHDDREAGEPIAELRDLSMAVDERFGQRVQGKIERRVLAGEFLGLAWAAPWMMLLEFLRAPFELLGERRQK